MNENWKVAVARFIEALEASPTLTAYRKGRKLLPPKPHHGADPNWGQRERESEDDTE